MFRALLMVLVSALALTGCTSSAERVVAQPRVSATASQSPTPSSTPEPTPSFTPSSTPEPTPEQFTPFPVELPLPAGPVNALIVGTDSREEGSLAGNADTIMLVHIPRDRSELYLISFPRDMFVPLIGFSEGKINAAYAYGGLGTLKATVSQLLGGGVPFDYTLQTNFGGFIAITRALGGFEVDNQYATSLTVASTGREVIFEEGPIWLENTDGLIYVRERKTLPLGDLDRTERQRAALIGILDRMKELFTEQPSAFPGLASALWENVSVTGDLSFEDVLGLIPLMESLTRDDVVSLMAPTSGGGSITYREHVGPESVQFVDEEQMAALGEAIRTDTMDQYVATYGTDYANE